MQSVYMLVMNNFKNDSRVLKEAVSLWKNGYAVHVLALYNEKDNLPQREIIYDNIKIDRIKLYTRCWPKNLLMQIIKYIEYLLCVVMLCRKADIIHCNDLEPLPTAVFAKLITLGRLKIAYDCHELETEKGHAGFLRKFLISMTERLLIYHCDSVITVSESIANEYVKRYKIAKPSLVLNCPHYCEIPKQNIFRNLWGISSEKKIFLYQGGLSPGRGIEFLIQTFQSMDDDNAILVIMGYGPLEEYIEEVALHSDSIFFHKAVSSTELLKYTASADIGFCILDNSCLNHYYCLPNKLFEYIMAGIPVICSNLFELRKMVKRHNCGYIFEEYTMEELRNVIKLALYKSKSTDFSHLNKVAKLYCWEGQEEELLKVYEKL